MVKLKSLKLVLIIVIVVTPLLFSCVTTSVSSQKIWKDKRKELIFFNYLRYICDNEMKKNNNYEKLQTFFNNCITPLDFYNRIQEYIDDAYKEIDPDIPSSQRHLTNIVNEIMDYNATLDCAHQSLLFIAGVKAVFSHYDDQLGKYVLNDDCGDFKIEIWRSFDLHPPTYPYRSHVQVVIDKWNGTDTFEIDNKTVNKIETDTWEDEFRTFNKRNDCLFFPFFPAKLNSILYTKSKFFPFDFLLIE